MSHHSRTRHQLFFTGGDLILGLCLHPCLWDCVNCMYWTIDHVIPSPYYRMSLGFWRRVDFRLDGFRLYVLRLYVFRLYVFRLYVLRLYVFRLYVFRLYVFRLYVFRLVTRRRVAIVYLFRLNFIKKILI